MKVRVKKIACYDAGDGYWEYQLELTDKFSKSQPVIVTINRPEVQPESVQVMVADTVDLDLHDEPLIFDGVKDLNHNDQVEIRFRAKAEQSAKLSFQVTHGGYELKEARTEYDVTDEWTEYRYVCVINYLWKK